MTDLIRRRLLQAGLSASAAGLLPTSIARAAAIAPDVRTGSLEDLRHVVILMQENRSFDHYFGTLSGVRGFGDRFPVPVAPLREGLARNVWLQPSATGDRLLAPFPLDTTRDFRYMRVEGTPHVWPDAQAAWDHGRMGQWPVAKQDHSLGYFRRADIPFQFALAEAFTICDAYHCSFQGGTNPNRVFLWCGNNDPLARAGGPVLANSHDDFPENGGHAASYSWRTYVEKLQEAGMSWQIYQDMADNFTDNPLAGFESFRRARRRDAGHSPQLRARGVATRTMAQLHNDVLQGRLPQVSYIIAGATDSEHPDPSSPAQGAAFTARLLDMLTADPVVWSRTALLVMFDENDGFFDHVPPPAPPSPDPSAASGYAGDSAVSTVGEYHLHPAIGAEKVDAPTLRGRPYGLGPRVPLYVISPWSRGGWVDSQVYDHTSVIRLLERRFGVSADISPWRRAVCGDLTAAFDFTQSDARPFLASLPDASAVAARAAALPGRTSPALPAEVSAPTQDTGLRRSRASPYRPDVRLVLDPAAASIALQMSCEGAATVLHVYDRLHLDALPRRYTVAPGAPLSGRWSASLDGYDLWILGAQGFHRHFVGRIDALQVTATMVADRQTPTVGALRLENPHATALDLDLRPGAYPDTMPTTRLHLQPGEQRTLELPLAATGGWYDLWIDNGGARQRLAGRVETGLDSISDPALGGSAHLLRETLPAD